MTESPCATRDFDVMAVAIQNTADDDNRIDALAALKRVEAALAASRSYLEEIKKLASDPFASEAVALRACLLAAYEGLGLPGPQPSPERDIAKAIIREARGE